MKENTNEMFTEAEVNALTNNDYEEDMVCIFTSWLNDAIANKKHLCYRDVKNDLTKIFVNNKLRPILISSIEICEMAEFKMDSYCEFNCIIDYLLELVEILGD